jgi:translation initiation factor RLI1
MQKCPFDAIEIINLPKDLEKDTTHRYGPNTFKLHRYFFNQRAWLYECVFFGICVLFNLA